jgi:hypothetical protein
MNKTSRWQYPFWLIWFALINALLCAIIASYNWPKETDFPIAASTFYLIALPAQFLMLAFVASLFPYLAHCALHWQKFTRWFAVVIFAVGMALVITDTKVFELYRFHLNAMVLNLFLGGALQDNLSFSFSLWAQIAGIVAVLFTLQWGLLLFIERFPRLFKTSINWWVSGFAAFWFLLANLVHGWHEAIGNTDVTTQVRYVPWFQPLTMKNLLRKLGVEVKPVGDDNNINVSQHSALNYPKAPLECRADQPLNVLVLMVDSLRFDMLDPQIMPVTSVFAEQTIRFENHYSSGNATRFGVFGFFYGIPSSYWTQVLAEERGSVLFDELVKQQYSIHLSSSAALTSPEFDRTAFSAVRDRIQSAPRKLSIAERDQWLTEAVIQQLKSTQDKPFFHFAFYDAPHGFGLPKDFVSPFQPMIETVNYLELGPDSDRVTFFNRYKATALFADQQIERVLNQLEANQLLDKTIVMITSDHGQEFNDLNKNYWGHNSNYSDYQVKVPMLIRWPGKAPATISALTAHEDVVPTLMQNILGCSNAISDYSTGENLFSPVADRALLIESWSDRAILFGDRIYQYTSYGAADIYDRQYNIQYGEKPNGTVVSSVLKKMTTFYQ